MTTKRHYELKGTPDEVEMPFELSGMMVDRKPATVTRGSTDLSGIGFEPPEVRPRPAPVEFTMPPSRPAPTPQYPPKQEGLGSISAPKTARRPLAGAVGYTIGFGALAMIVYHTSKFLSEEAENE